MWISEGGPRRAVLGVQIDPASGKEGARVLSVSPGGAAADAGLAKGDVIVALDGEAIAGSPNPNRVVVDHMRTVNPEQKVKVRVLRDGKNKDYVVVARPYGSTAFQYCNPGGGAMGAVVGGPRPFASFRFWPGDFDGIELASMTPKLGAYFGTSEGVLVVQAPKNAAFKLEDGDVLQSIDGRKPEDGGHALRILRSYKSGEKLSMMVLRQRKSVTLAIVMPERPEFDGDFMQPVPPIRRFHRFRQWLRVREAEPDPGAVVVAVNSPPCVAATSPTSFPMNSSPSSRSRNDPRAGCCNRSTAPAERWPIDACATFRSWSRPATCWSSMTRA